MSNLLEFIEARLAEDEAWALAASAPYKYAAEGATVPPGGVHWTWVVGENWTPVEVDPAVDDTVGGPEHYGCPVNLASVETWRNEGSDHGWRVHTMPRTVANEMVEVDSSAAGHIVRHDPARVLREVTARRRTLARHHRDPRGDCVGCGWSGDLDEGRTEADEECPELLDMASVWNDDPSYDPSWSPS